MSRVVIVSNRVTDPLKAAQAGGVAVAIADCLKERDGLWFGWSGTLTTELLPDSDNDSTVSIDTNDGIARATTPLTDIEYRDYYLGYSNSVLWPVFHNRVDLAQFEAGYYDAYSSVNKRFAKALTALLLPDDVIWVHDYHFICLAKELRALGVNNRIGFFLHIPFPPSQSFLAIPEHRELAHAFAAYDLIGLQATTDVAHLIDYLEHGARGQMLPDGRMRVGEREFSIASFPVGIDSNYFKNINSPSVQDLNRDIVRIIGVDRLDYTKGLPQKFRAFGRFLQTNPKFRNKTILTQIAAPTRESVEAYADIRKELESLSGSINGTYGDLEWVPIHYINRTASRERLAGVYRASNIGLVTPLRDGMNLVAKEYVASQIASDPGVLILSQFAGAAEQLTDALIVNPYNVEEIAASISIAIAMSLEERRARYVSLMRNIENITASMWATSFLEALVDRSPFRESPPSGGRRLRRAIKRLSHAPAPPKTSTPTCLSPSVRNHRL